MKNMRKICCSLLFLSLISSIYLIASADEAVSYIPTIELFSNSSRVVYTEKNYDVDSFTELRTNRYGFTVPVRFESTGYKRIVNGQVWYRYVGIIEDTKFGVRE